MLNLRMRKVLRDLASSKARTLLVVLAIAVGVFALSLTLRTQALLSATMLAQYRAIDPAQITLTSPPFTTALVKSIRRMQGVRDADGDYRLQVRLRVGNEWRQLILVAIDDPSSMQVNLLKPEQGVWPPPRRTIALERSYLGAVGGQLGTPLQIETADGHGYELPLTATVHDLTAASGRLGDSILFGYISMDTLEWLGQPRAFNELQIAVAGDPFDTDYVRGVAAQARSRLEDEAGTVTSTSIHEPDKPELYTIIASILQTLAMLGTLSLVLSTFLVINTINGLLARQVPQIGVLKAIGARARDIFNMYLTAVFLFALLALLVAVPLGSLGAQALTAQLAWMLNYDTQRSTVPLYVPALEVTTGLVAPLLAALYPIIAGTRITVRQAISGQGGSQFGESRIDQLSRRVRGLPTSMLYALRNMLRRKGRLILTLAALSLGGAIVIAVLSVRASLSLTLDQVTDYWRQDLTVTFDSPQRVEQIANDVQGVPGVAELGYQMAVLGSRERPDGTESEQQSAIFGVLPDSPMMHPTLTEGRWLAPDDTNALVVNVDFLHSEPDVHLGSPVSLKIDGRKSGWLVVGVVTSQLIGLGSPKPGQPMAYISYAPLAATMRESGYANRAVIVTERHDAAFQSQVAQAVQRQLDAASLHGNIQTRESIRTLIAGLFSTIFLLLLVMALVFILVGGLSLTGAMSLNVLERIKEIGVLRAIGASNSSILRIVLAEGIAIGVLSWMLATVLAVPLSKILSALIGLRMLNWPLVYTFPLINLLIWLMAVIALSSLASYLPARGATRVAVRDVLAYE